ncbi:HTH domain-containing protein [Neolewinella agarilytica]|uniref:HTH domain-containing protein n=1 Tax=Neolewinella agarilytica TaxID=478744 RepID=UPI002352EAAA|nr:helix-turn-helix domain-containing protein [Neolewinella agarilytica]
MAFIDTFYQLERLAHLIQRKATGSPTELAAKLEVSPRTVHNLLEQLRNWGAEIAYCRERCSYYYVQPINLCFSVIQPAEDARKITGGRKNISSFLLDAEFLRWGGASLYC